MSVSPVTGQSLLHENSSSPSVALSGVKPEQGSTMLVAVSYITVLSLHSSDSPPGLGTDHECSSVVLSLRYQRYSLFGIFRQVEPPLVVYRAIKVVR